MPVQKKKTKRLKGYWSFSSDIMAVKGLMAACMNIFRQRGGHITQRDLLFVCLFFSQDDDDSRSCWRFRFLALVSIVFFTFLSHLASSVSRSSLVGSSRTPLGSAVSHLRRRGKKNRVKMNKSYTPSNVQFSVGVSVDVPLSFKDC